MSAASGRRFVAPVVDHLSVRVAVDSRYGRFLPRAEHPFVTIEHVGAEEAFATRWLPEKPPAEPGGKPGFVSWGPPDRTALAPDVVLPMHCTGTPFIEAMRARMPDQLVGSNLVSRFTLGV